MSKMRYFKVLGGSHNEAGVNYPAGKVVPTERNLTEEFGPNQFKEVSRKGRVLDEDSDEADGDVTELADDAETKGKKKTSEDTTKTTEAASEAAEASSKRENVTSKLGDDVTDRFPSIVSDNDLAVVKEGKHYFVVDRDEPDKAIKIDGKEEKLSNKEDVLSFIDRFLNPAKE